MGVFCLLRHLRKCRVAVAHTRRHPYAPGRVVARPVVTTVHSPVHGGNDSVTQGTGISTGWEGFWVTHKQ